MGVFEDNGYRTITDVRQADLDDLIGMGLGTFDAQRLFDACIVSGEQQQGGIVIVLTRHCDKDSDQWGLELDAESGLLTLIGCQDGSIAARSERVRSCIL